MGRIETRMERLKKKERERNNLAEGPRFRTERNNLKKVGTCPALTETAITIKQNKQKKREGHLFNERVIVHCLKMAQRQRLVNILSKEAP